MPTEVLDLRPVLDDAASPVKTLLATYAHVIRTDEDRVRNVVDDTRGGSAEDWLRAEAG